MHNDNETQTLNLDSCLEIPYETNVFVCFKTYRNVFLLQLWLRLTTSSPESQSLSPEYDMDANMAINFGRDET